MINEARNRKKKTFEEFVAEMYDQPMPTVSGVPKPKPRRTPESTAAIKRRENLPPETKLRNIENDIARQKELENQALHNITSSGNTPPPPTEGESSEDTNEKLRKKRIETFGSLNPMRHKDEPEKYAHELPQQIPARKPPSSTPRPAPASPRKVKITPPAAPIKRG